jgi:hypothetical protein
MKNFKRVLSIAILGGLMLSFLLSSNANALAEQCVPTKTYYIKEFLDYDGDDELDYNERIQLYQSNMPFEMDFQHDSLDSDGATVYSKIYSQIQIYQLGWSYFTGTWHVSGTPAETAVTILEGNSTGAHIIETNCRVYNSLSGMDLYTPPAPASIEYIYPADDEIMITTPNGNDVGWANIEAEIAFDIPLDITKYSMNDVYWNAGISGGNVEMGDNYAGYDEVLHKGRLWHEYPSSNSVTKYSEPWVDIDVMYDAITHQEISSDTVNNRVSGLIDINQGWTGVGNWWLWIEFSTPDGKWYHAFKWIVVRGFIDSNGDGRDDDTGQTQEEVNHDNSWHYEAGDNSLNEIPGGTEGMLNTIINSLSSAWDWIPKMSIMYGLMFGWLPNEIQEYIKLGIYIGIFAFILAVIRGK